jgi:hypothetical protein
MLMKWRHCRPPRVSSLVQMSIYNLPKMPKQMVSSKFGPSESVLDGTVGVKFLVQTSVYNFPKMPKQMVSSKFGPSESVLDGTGVECACYSMCSVERASLNLIHSLRNYGIGHDWTLTFLFVLLGISECHIVIGTFVSRSRMANEIAKAIGRRTRGPVPQFQCSMEQCCCSNY